MVRETRRPWWYRLLPPPHPSSSSIPTEVLTVLERTRRHGHTHGHSPLPATGQAKPRAGPVCVRKQKSVRWYHSRTRLLGIANGASHGRGSVAAASLPGSDTGYAPTHASPSPYIFIRAKPPGPSIACTYSVVGGRLQSAAHRAAWPPAACGLSFPAVSCARTLRFNTLLPVGYRKLSSPAGGFVHKDT